MWNILGFFITVSGWQFKADNEIAVSNVKLALKVSYPSIKLVFNGRLFLKLVK